MKNLDPQEGYPQLFDAFGKLLAIPPAIVREFVQRTEIMRIKRNEIIADGIELSTHGYFIISGLIMSYVPCEGSNHVNWIRTSNDYAYSMDMFRFQFGYEPALTGNVLVALEDTVAISIHHEDSIWLQENSVEMCILINTLIMSHTEVNLCIQQNEMREPADRYNEMQLRVSFSLSRVPDIYLASLLRITLAELKEVRERIQQQ